MAVVIETTIGDFTIDLFVESRPQACKNFLKLCKMKYYNFCLFHSVQPNFLAQTGDPSGTGSGGESIYGLLYGENVRYFEAEMMPKLKHNKPGLLSMVNCGNNMLGSQFFITLGEDMVSLDGTHCVFGEITEGVDIVLKLNEAICDTLHRPYKDIRITHTIILEDPFEDPSGLVAPDMSPEATQERLANGRIAADEEIDEMAGMSAAQVEEMKQQREANARATILEIVGDLPDAEMAPPENVLFVCKLNPVTTDDDLEIIFSRFGKVKSCEVIRDKTTGDSLQYAFVEFEDQKSCEEAYFKMDNVLIDDRRIHVDFSQSVAKMQWKGKGRGVIYHDSKDQSKDVRSSSHREREDSKSRSKRDKDYDDKERRRDRGRDREDDRQGRERGRDRDADDRHRKRDERDRSRSDWRKRDSKHRKDDYRDDEKRYDSKRKDFESSRRKDDDSKRVSSSTSVSRKVDDRRTEEKRIDDKRSDDRKRDKESRDVSNKSSSRLAELEKNTVIEKQNVRANVEKIEIKEKERGSKFNSPVPNISREDNSSDKFINDCKEMTNISGDLEVSLETTVSNDVSLVDARMNHVDKKSSKENKRLADEEMSKEVENGDTGDEKFSQNSEKRLDDLKKSETKKKTLKRKRKVSENRKRKKRHHSSSSESSSETSDSSDSSTSSDSSDHRHGKKKKLIVAKRYYRGGKLVKEVKKKKRTKDTTDSGSVSEDSSDTDSKRKHKSKKHKKIINIVKHFRRKNDQSSDDSQSGSSSSDDSDFKDKKKKRKIAEKRLKKKLKNSASKKKRQRKEETTSSSDSEGSVQNSVSSKSSKKLRKSKNVKHNTSLLETNSSK